MAPFNSRSVSKGIAVAILAGCLLLGVLLGVSTSNNGSGSNLRSTGVQTQEQKQTHELEQQQQAQRKLARGQQVPAQIIMPVMDRASLEHQDKAGGADFVWEGDFAALENGLDTIDLATDFSMSYDYVY